MQYFLPSGCICSCVCLCVGGCGGGGGRTCVGALSTTLSSIFSSITSFPCPFLYRFGSSPLTTLLLLYRLSSISQPFSLPRHPLLPLLFPLLPLPTASSPLPLLPTPLPPLLLCSAPSSPLLNPFFSSYRPLLLPFPLPSLVPFSPSPAFPLDSTCCIPNSTPYR